MEQGATTWNREAGEISRKYRHKQATSNLYDFFDKFPTNASIISFSFALPTTNQRIDIMPLSTKLIVPLLDRVLLQRIKAPEKTALGILIPEKSQEVLNEALVIAVGKGALDKNGNHIKPQVEVGNTVLLPAYGGTNIKANDTEYVIFRDSELVAKVEPKP
ncbi:chaperonin 10 kd subunit-domain-containing protein [Endogone sp. FLAS-F59071]|nr:chaperonin 10 kd subunit-domain-containing protein [Endogone sp. FLAS-F59071]|eukprot:RUS21672.1 chaperonin 10 kd subunit-domain-containing protein [Endogone sp. FLAS-F59071]